MITLQEGQYVLDEDGNKYLVEKDDVLIESSGYEKQLEVQLYKLGLNGKSISIIMNTLKSSNDMINVGDTLYSLMKKKTIPVLDDDTLDIILSYTTLI